MAERFDCPLVIEVNAILSREASRFRHLCMADVAEEIERFVLNRADAVVVVSAALRDALIDLGIAGDKIHVVPNGVDLDLFDVPCGASGAVKALSSEHGKNESRSNEPETHAAGTSDLRARLGLEDRFVALFVGSLKPWHGVDVLLDALAKLGEVRDEAGRVPHVVVVGVGPQEQSLRDRAAELGVAHRVTFVGGVAHEQVPGYVACADVAVAPYRCMEGFYFSPVKLFEYMAAGRCVIASGLGQIADVIRDGHNGLLCPGDDAEALARAIEKAMGNRSLRERLGGTARQDAAVKHSWDQTARRVTEVIETVRSGSSCDGSSAGCKGFGKPVKTTGTLR